MSSVSSTSSVKPPVVVTTPKKSVGQTIARAVTSTRYSKDTIKRYEAGQLSPVYSGLVTLTKTPLKAIGSALTVILAPFAGIKLFNGSDSNDSIFKSWKFLTLLGLGAVTSFGANSYLSSSSNGEGTTPIVKGAAENTNDLKRISDPQKALISDFFNDLFKEFYGRVDKMESIGGLIKLPSMGIEIKKGFVRTFHQKEGSMDKSICQTFIEDGKTRTMGLRVNLNGIKSALEDPTNPIHKFDIEFIVKDPNDEDAKFEPMAGTPYTRSISQLTEEGLIVKEELTKPGKTGQRLVA